MSDKLLDTLRDFARPDEDGGTEESFAVFYYRDLKALIDFVQAADAMSVRISAVRWQNTEAGMLLLIDAWKSYDSARTALADELKEGR